MRTQGKCAFVKFLFKLIFKVIGWLGKHSITFLGLNLRCSSAWWGKPLLLPLIGTALFWANCVLGMLMHGGGKKIGSKGPNWHIDWFDGKLGRQDVWSWNERKFIKLYIIWNFLSLIQNWRVSNRTCYISKWSATTFILKTL